MEHKGSVAADQKFERRIAECGWDIKETRIINRTKIRICVGRNSEC
jgi:hypothetical protein